MPNVSFEQQVISQVVQAHMTPERIKEMAQSMGPAIEKVIKDKLLDTLSDCLDDRMWEYLDDAMRTVKFDKIIGAIIKERLGVR